MQTEILYKRKEEISSRKLGSELMLYDGDSDKVHVLNETGQVVWELLDGKNSKSHIEKNLKEKFNDTPKETISKDLTEIIEKLKAEGLVNTEDSYE